MAAALEVGAPPDVTRLEEGYVARMRAQKALLDITDIMNEMKKVPGGVNPSVIPLTEDGGRNFAVPMGLNPEVMHARMDLLEQAGYSAFPETWDKFVEASLRINKPPFYAYGMALGTSPGNDSTEDIMACVWANGGHLIDMTPHPARCSAPSWAVSPSVGRFRARVRLATNRRATPPSLVYTPLEATSSVEYSGTRAC
jgi:multiple sugar transport system substrate-binding protein